jgi:hypothetical protein
MPAKPPDRAAGQRRPKASRKPPAKASRKASLKKPCPICGKPATAAAEPFCSERCRGVDLNRWLSGSYVIPGKPTDDEDAE